MRTSLDIVPGIYSDDTNFKTAGRWGDGDNARFWLGQPQPIGGWEKLTSTLLAGVCRGALPWTDYSTALNVAFGTHVGLQVWRDELIDVTPTLGHPSITLTDPFTVEDASDLVTVDHPGHGLATDDDVVISGARPVGRITLAGTYPVTVVDVDTYTITHGSPADLAETLGSNPLQTTASSPLVKVTDTAHGFWVGLPVTISGAAAVGGITPNGTFPIKEVIDANTYTFNYTDADGGLVNASSAATGGGAAVVVTVPAVGGGEATIAPQNAFSAGSTNGTGGAGFGTGTWGTGEFGSPSKEDFFPRTWSFAPLGQWLIGNPRGAGIYVWKNDAGTRAAPVPNSPRQVTAMLVGPNDEVFAFGCNEMVSGRFNPLCIRHSDLRDAFGPRHDIWMQTSGNNAREYILRGGGRIVSARLVGRYILVWTTNALYLGQYAGAEDQVWKFDLVAQNCGLIGPNAAVVVGATAYWLSPDLQVRHFTLGGASGMVLCPIRRDVADNLALVQGDKIVASSNSKFNEIRFDYPDARDGPDGTNGVENSRYIAASVDMLKVAPDQAWYRGRMARSVMVDAGVAGHPVGTNPAGVIYLHERGESADGGPLNWRIKSADQYLDENTRVLLRGLWPDFAGQKGAVSVTATSRELPQGDERSEGPYSLAPGQQKQDFRLGGRLFNFEFSGNAAPSAGRLGKISVDIAPMGGR